MLLIEILLGIAALYSGGMYAFQFTVFIRNYSAYVLDPSAADAAERYTFHLGICFIVSLGFLGLILVSGG